MRKQPKAFLTICLLLLATSCLVKEDPTATYSELMVTRGDLVVASFTSDALVVFGQDGTFKKVLYQLPNPVGDNITALTWFPETNEILIAIDGTPDRIDAFSVLTGSVRTFYNNITYFTGTTLGMAQLQHSKDIIVSEGPTIERFSANGTRETWTTIWPTSVHANSQQLVGLSTGNWLTCSSTAGVKIYPDTTATLVQVATATSALAGTTAAYACGELSTGKILVAWNGTNDAIQSYSATLTGVTTLFPANVAVLQDPKGMAIGENDEIYVTDGTRNVVLEIDHVTGEKVNEFGNSYLQSPRAILVIPAFN